MLKWIVFVTIIAIVLGLAAVIIESLFPLEAMKTDKNKKT